MSSAPPQAPYERIADLLTRGKLVLFLGPDTVLSNRPPGASWQRDCDFPPTDVELARFLASKHHIPLDISHALHLIEVASYIQESSGRYRLLEDLQSAFSGHREPQGIYKYLASIPAALVIVTTNYDDLLERAFTRANHPFDRISFAQSWRSEELPDSLLWWRHNKGEPVEVRLTGLELDLSRTTIIIKIRGTIDQSSYSSSFGSSQRRDSIIITDDDYLDLLVRLASQPSLPPTLGHHFEDSNFLFLGFGLLASNLRMLLKSLMRAWRLDLEHRQKSWVFQRKPSWSASSFWWKQNAELYDADPNSVADNLAYAERASVDKTISRMQDVSRPLPKVFISYAREDSVEAKAVYRALKAAGFQPWRDKEAILPGEEWDPKIRRSLKDSDFLLMCLSSKSISKRGYVQKEIRMALDIAQEFPLGAIFLIPVRFDECEVPQELARYQHVDWFSRDGPGQVLRAIAVGWRRRNG